MTGGGSFDLTWSSPEKIRLATILFSVVVIGLLVWGFAAYALQNRNVLPLSAAVTVGGTFVILILVIRRTGVTLRNGVLHADGIGGKRAIEVATAPRIKLRTEQQTSRLELSVYPAHGPAAQVSILDATRCQPPENLLALSAALESCPAPHAGELAAALTEQAQLGTGTAAGLTPRPSQYAGKAITVAALLNLLQLLP